MEALHGEFFQRRTGGGRFSASHTPPWRCRSCSQADCSLREVGAIDQVAPLLFDGERRVSRSFRWKDRELRATSAGRPRRWASAPRGLRRPGRGTRAGVGCGPGHRGRKQLDLRYGSIIHILIIVQKPANRTSCRRRVRGLCPALRVESRPSGYAPWRLRPGCSARLKPTHMEVQGGGLAVPFIVPRRARRQGLRADGACVLAAVVAPWLRCAVPRKGRAIPPGNP